MGYSEERLARLQGMHATHFWYRQHRRIVRRWVGGTVAKGAVVADVGCGPGDMVRWLAGAGYRVVAVDVLAGGLERMRAEGVRAEFVMGSAEALPLGEGVLDGMLLLDVMEHLDDGAVLAEAGRVVKAGGMLMISVPAFGFLWGVRDEDAGHRRRYTCAGLKKVVEGAGFEVVRTQHYQFLLFPLLVAARVVGRKSRKARDREDRPSGLVNGVLNAVNAVEVTVGRVVRYPVGSTVLMLARRRGE